MHSTNTHLARAFATKFAPALGAEGAALVDETSAPQQRNSYDCGVFAMVEHTHTHTHTHGPRGVAARVGLQKHTHTNTQHTVMD
jgi:hypothetical protein